MKKLSLNSAWMLDIPDTSYCSVPAQVPGSVYHDLLCANLIPDPLFFLHHSSLLTDIYGMIYTGKVWIIKRKP